MATIDLTKPAPPPTGLLDALPRRVALTLRELQLVAELAGGAPLPFDLVDPFEHRLDAGPRGGLEGRLGESRGTLEDRAYVDAIAALHDPRSSLRRRGLLIDGAIDPGLAGAVGLLATPEVAVDLDVAAGGPSGGHVRGWHRQSGGAVAALATADGVVFELAWFPTAAWPDELARVAVPPEGLLGSARSAVPSHLELPYALADAAMEAAATHRQDLLPVLAAQHSGAVTGPSGTPLLDAELPGVLAALAAEAQGRLRALVARVARDRAQVVGVRSWVLLADGWRTLHPLHDGERVAVTAIEPADLAADLAPVLAEVGT